MIENTLDDHLIQVDMSFDPAFASRTPRELYQVDCMVEAAQAELIKEFEARQAQELAPTYEQDDEGESEIEIEDRDVPDDCYPSGSEAGDLSDEEGEIHFAENENEDQNEEMEEVVVQESRVVQGVQTTGPSAPVPKPRTLDKQQDKDVEVTIRRGKHFPSGLVNASGENHDDPFEIPTISRGTTNKISSIAQVVCLVITILHFLAGLATSWCEFLLAVFVVLFNAMGREDIAKEIPSRLPTATVNAGLPTSNVSILAVCPTCGDVFPTGLGTPVECPRCSVPLFEGLMNPPKQPIPPATRRALVPRIRLPFLSISAQLEDIINSPGIEEDLDWWRKLDRREGVYRDISDGRIWNEVLGPDGQEFFRSVNVDGKKCAPDGELRIGVALAMDW